MATTLQKIQDIAGRIDRLGQYTATDTAVPTVRKSKGVLTLFDLLGEAPLMCSPKDGRVWYADYPATADLETGLGLLVKFEALLKVKAERLAREEVLQELVARKIRRIVKPKTRGFKADQKRKKAKAARTSSE